MAKYKHNKKKNSAFLYETLVLELTKSVLNKDLAAKAKITNIIKESFGPRTALYQELNYIIQFIKLIMYIQSQQKKS